MRSGGNRRSSVGNLTLVEHQEIVKEGPVKKQAKIRQQKRYLVLFEKMLVLLAKHSATDDISKNEDARENVREAIMLSNLKVQLSSAKKPTVLSFTFSDESPAERILGAHGGAPLKSMTLLFKDTQERNDW